MQSFKCDKRDWLLRDGEEKNLHTERVSTMKRSFGYPQPEKIVKGRRAELLLEKMRREAEAEASAECTPQPKIEKYITTYDDTYCPSDPNFEANPPPRARELYEKYPLYDNPAKTYWKQQHERHVSERPPIGGTMVTVNFNNPFKKNSRFSTPLEDLVDGGQIDR